MPVFEQGYRPYHGDVRRGSRAVAIAWESLRPRMRWWIWMLLALLLLISPYTLYGAVTFAVLMAGMGTVPAATIPTEAFSIESDPMSFVGAVTQSSGAFFWHTINVAFAVGGPVILVAVACSGLLAADRRTGALQIYFARPVSRTDYLAGKVLVAVAFCGMLTAFPSIALWVECAALHPKVDYLSGTWWVPLACLATSAQYALWTAGLVLFLSSMLQRPVLIGTIAIFTYFFFLSMGEVLEDALDEKRWLALAPHYAIGGVTASYFQLDRPDWLPLWLCLGHAVVFPALCFLVVVRRLRAVEVVT